MKRGLRYRIAPQLYSALKDVALGLKDEKLADTTHVFLGKLGEQGPIHSVYWSFEQECVLGIFGKRGSGKSYTLGVFLEGLACDTSAPGIGKNMSDRAVLVFDTLNIFQYAVVPVSEIPDSRIREKSQQAVKSFGLKEWALHFSISYPAGKRLPFYPESYEPFALDTALIRPEDYGHIFNIDIYREPLGHLLLAAYDAIKETGYSEGVRRVSGSSTAGLSDLIKCLSSDEGIREGFAADTIRALLARLRSLHGDELFSSTPTPMNTLLCGGRVRVLLLGQLSPPLRSVVAALLIRQAFNMRSCAAEASKLLRLRSSITPEQEKEARKVFEQSPPRTLVCIDEAQGYAPPTKSNPCTEVLIQYVKEGRNHGLSFLFTSQQPSAIHSEILSQMDGVIAHRLTVNTDIEATLKNAKGRAPDKISSGQQNLSEAELLRELTEGQAWVSQGDASRSFVLEVRPRITAHGGLEV